MSYVQFKKFLCRPVDFSGEHPLNIFSKAAVFKRRALSGAPIGPTCRGYGGDAEGGGSSQPEGQLSVCTRRCHQPGPGVGLSDVCVPAPSPPWVVRVSFYIATRKHQKKQDVSYLMLSGPAWSIMQWYDYIL